MVKGGQALVANFYQDGVTYAGRVSSLCASLSLALLVGARFYDSFGIISVSPAAVENGIDPSLIVVDGTVIEKLQLGWMGVCRFPHVTDTNFSESSNAAPVCERFRRDHLFDLRTLGSPSNSRLCDSLSYASFCDGVHVCEITWFVAAVLSIFAATFSEKSSAVLFLCFLAFASVAVTLGFWDKTLHDVSDGFGIDTSDDEWGLSFRMIQSACATLGLAVAFAFIDCTRIKDVDAQYTIFNDGIEITGRIGVVCGILCWVSFACGYGTSEWYVSESFVSTRLEDVGLSTSQRLSFGLTQWCAEKELQGDLIEYCMWYEHDPWGETRQTACHLFGSAQVCRETYHGRIILMSAIVTSFVVDIYSEKMLLNGIFGLFSGVMGLYVLLSMDVMADDVSSEYISGGSDLKRADGWWFTFTGVIFASCAFVLCLLDWCDCCGLKDTCFCLHCGTAGSATFSD